MPRDGESAQQPPQHRRIEEAGNVEKRGGWLKPTAEPTNAMSRPQQGMPDKPQGNGGGQSGGQGQSSNNE